MASPGGPGGVKNLRAMFEQGNSSTPTTPSLPVGNITPNRELSPKPLSRVRTSFVAVAGPTNGPLFGLKLASTTNPGESSKPVEDPVKIDYRAMLQEKKENKAESMVAEPVKMETPKVDKAEQKEVVEAKVKPVAVKVVEQVPVEEKKPVPQPVQVKPEPVKAEPAKAEPAKAEPVKAEPAKAEPAKVQTAKASAKAAEKSTVKPEKAETAKPLKPTTATTSKSRPTTSAGQKASTSAPKQPPTSPTKATTRAAAAMKPPPPKNLTLPNSATAKKNSTSPLPSPTPRIAPKATTSRPTSPKRAPAATTHTATASSKSRVMEKTVAASRPRPESSAATTRAKPPTTSTTTKAAVPRPPTTATISSQSRLFAPTAASAARLDKAADKANEKAKSSNLRPHSAAGTRPKSSLGTHHALVKKHSTGTQKPVSKPLPKPSASDTTSHPIPPAPSETFLEKITRPTYSSASKAVDKKDLKDVGSRCGSRMSNRGTPSRRVSNGSSSAGSSPRNKFAEIYKMKAPVLPIPKDEEVSEEAVEDSGNESSRPAKESEHVQQHAAEHHKESGLSNVSEALASEEVDHEDHPIGNGALDSSEVHTPLVNEDEVNNNNKNNVNVPEDTQKDGEKHIEEGDRKADIETGETKKNGGA